MFVCFQVWQLQLLQYVHDAGIDAGGFGHRAGGSGVLPRSHDPVLPVLRHPRLAVHGNESVTR